MTFALFILYLALSYIHPGEIVPALAPYRVAYWIGMAGLTVAIASLLTRRDGVRTNLQLLVLVVFAVVTALSLTIADRWPGAPLLAMQRFGPSVAMFVLAIAGVTTLTRLRIAAVCIIVLTMVLAIQGAAAYHLGYNAGMFLLDPAARGDVPSEPEPDRLDLVPLDHAADAPDAEEGFEEERIRGLGMMHDPNDLAMGMIVAFGLIAGAWRARPLYRNGLFAAAAAALVYGIYLTRSRGGAVALVIVLWRLAASRIGRVPALVLLVALSAGLVALDYGGRQFSIEPDESASGRLIAWSEGLEMLKEKPILGVGYGQFQDYHTLTAHNSLVLCFAETGLVGCFFWVGLIVVTVLELHGLERLAGTEPFDVMARQWAAGLQLSLIGFLSAAFFLSRTFVPTLYLIIGLSAALAAVARKNGRTIPLPALPVLATLVSGCELAGIGLVYAIVKLRVV